MADAASKKKQKKEKPESAAKAVENKPKEKKNKKTALKKHKVLLRQVEYKYKLQNRATDKINKEERQEGKVLTPDEKKAIYDTVKASSRPTGKQAEKTQKRWDAISKKRAEKYKLKEAEKAKTHSFPSRKKKLQIKKAKIAAIKEKRKTMTKEEREAARTKPKAVIHKDFEEMWQAILLRSVHWLQERIKESA